MNHKTILTAAALLALLAPGAGMAQDAMAGDSMAGDAMAGDAMAPMMSDEELATCLEQAGAIIFPEVAAAAEHACHDLHNGETIEGDSMMSSEPMAGDAMGGDAMAPQ